MATCSQWSTEEESPSHPVPRLTPTSPSPTRSPPDRNKTKGNSIGQGEPVDGGGASDLGAPNLRGGEQGRRIFRERFHTMTTIDNDSSSGEDQDEEARIIKENPLVLVKVYWCTALYSNIAWKSPKICAYDYLRKTRSCVNSIFITHVRELAFVGALCSTL